MITNQPSLFGPSAAPGLEQFNSFITRAEELTLIDHINTSDLAPFSFHGWLGKRKTSSFGWRYDFDQGTFGPIRPLPAWIFPFRDRAAACVGIASEAFVQALLIRYDPGAGVGWHRDRLVYEHIFGVSLGAPASMRLRRRTGSRFERMEFPLTPRAAYHLSGEIRHDWEHQVLPMDQTRWSVTFRTLSEKGRNWRGPR